MKRNKKQASVSLRRSTMTARTHKGEAPADDDENGESQWKANEQEEDEYVGDGTDNTEEEAASNGSPARRQPVSKGQRAVQFSNIPHSLDAESQGRPVFYSATPTLHSPTSPSTTSIPSIFLPVLLPLRLQVVYDLVVFLSTWSTKQDDMMRNRMIETDNGGPRAKPEYCMNTIAGSNKTGEVDEYSCWDRYIVRKGLIGQNVDPQRACTRCLKAGVECIYFAFVDGVVTKAGTWSQGKVTERYEPEKHSIGGKRWRLFCRTRNTIL